MAAFMGKDVKKLKAKGGGKVSNFFSPLNPCPHPVRVARRVARAH